MPVCRSTCGLGPGCLPKPKKDGLYANFTPRFGDPALVSQIEAGAVSATRPRKLNVIGSDGQNVRDHSWPDRVRKGDLHRLSAFHIVGSSRHSRGVAAPRKARISAVFRPVIQRWLVFHCCSRKATFPVVAELLLAAID